MMKALFFAVCAGFIIHVGAADIAPSSREGIEWCDIWVAHANETKLPRVLLIGDSITRGYSGEVDKRLAGKAYVARLATSAFLSDPMLLQQIAMVLDGAKYDVVHFNNGMHGWQHHEEEYKKHFPAFLAIIQKHAPGAKLIWAATTPLKDSIPVKPGEVRASDERIEARNAIALELVKPLGIPVDDLYKLVKGHADYYNGDVHFNARGIAAQADQVAAEVEKVLGK